MAARISYMYRESGGCRTGFFCRDCKEIELEKKRSGVDYKCRRHAELTGEEAAWKGSWIACKWFLDEPKYEEGEHGQIRFV